MARVDAREAIMAAYNQGAQRIGDQHVHNAATGQPSSNAGTVPLPLIPWKPATRTWLSRSGQADLGEPGSAVSRRCWQWSPSSRTTTGVPWSGVRSPDRSVLLTRHPRVQFFRTIKFTAIPSHALAKMLAPDWFGDVFSEQLKAQTGWVGPAP